MTTSTIDIESLFVFIFMGIMCIAVGNVVVYNGFMVFLGLFTILISMMSLIGMMLSD